MRPGDTITPYYDPMIAKVIVHEDTRDAARIALGRALDDTHVAGTVTNVRFLSALAENADFASGDVDTGLIERHAEALTAEAASPPEAVALASLAALGLPKVEGVDPWESLTGWRAWGPAQQGSLLERDGERIEAKVTIHGPGTFTVKIADDTTRLAFLDGGPIDIDGITRRAETVSHPGGVTVFLDGEAHDFALPDPAAPKQDTAAGDTIVAPMPGSVKKVSTSAGATVAAGAAVIVLEAMKMEHTLKALRDGTVAELLVAEGDQVEDGAVLLALEPAADDAT